MAKPEAIIRKSSVTRLSHKLLEFEPGMRRALQLLARDRIQDFQELGRIAEFQLPDLWDNRERLNNLLWFGGTSTLLPTMLTADGGATWRGVDERAGECTNGYRGSG